MAGLDLTGGTTSALTQTGGTINYTNPDWYNNMMSGTAAQAGTLTGSGPGSIASNLANWNVDPSTGQPAQLTGDWNQNLQGASTAAAGAMQPGGYLQQATGQVQNAAAYDPSKFNQFLNPYTQDAAAATTNLSNKNLFENVLPGVNSTFTGAGQFGSARNADFENRAIRDQQQTLTNSLGTLNYGAAKDAANQYSDWANKGITAGMDTAQLGQQDITNQAATGKSYLDWQTQGMQANYNDYLKQLQYPLDAMGALTQTAGALKGSVQPNQTLTPGELSKYQKAMMLAGIGNSATTNTNGPGTSPLDSVKAAWDWVTTNV